MTEDFYKREHKTDQRRLNQGLYKKMINDRIADMVIRKIVNPLYYSTPENDRRKRN